MKILKQSNDGKVTITKSNKAIYGGHYTVTAIKNGKKSIKNGLCLDAALEIYKKLKRNG